MIHPLESRLFMAAQLVLDSDLYRTLVIIDNGKGNDKVAITGTNDNGSISTTVDLGYEEHVIDGYLDAVFIDLGAGNDRLELVLEGYGSLDTFIDVTLGAGKDRAKFNVDKQIGNIYGNGGNDKIALVLDHANPVGQTIFGGSGNDVIHGAMGADVLIGGSGRDLLVAYGGDDIVDGYGGDDSKDGNDLIFAGTGRDLLYGGPGKDRIHGEGGDDVFIAEHPLLVTPDFGDTYIGGPGFDEFRHYGDDDLEKNRFDSVEETKQVEVIEPDPNELP